MKAQLITKSPLGTGSFSLTEHAFKTFLKIWHFHPQLELVISLESEGIRFVGDSIENFKPGDIILIGKGLPHLWLNDKIYFQEHNLKMAKAFVIHFEESFGNDFFRIPEMSNINDLLGRARRGVKFLRKKLYDTIVTKVERMFEMTEAEKVISFLDILNILAEEKEYKLLASAGYVSSFDEIRNSKIAIVYKHIMNNFKADVRLGEVAALANMTPVAFSRYFKKVHKNTFIQYLNEVRIGYACKLMTEDKYTIAEVCYAAGFRNLSNFNRHFKHLKKMAPSEYIKMHAQR